MPKRPKWFTDMKLVLPPLREYWREVNRQDRANQEGIRNRRKELDAKRPRCRCEAYKFPHRPGGGLCCYPELPATTWKEREAAEVEKLVQTYIDNHGVPNTMTMDELRALMAKKCRPYRKRYVGLRKQIARANGLHPIRDKAEIAGALTRVINMVKTLKRQKLRLKDCRFREVELDDQNIRLHRPAAGPEWRANPG